jgi:hypothetical protein
MENPIAISQLPTFPITEFFLHPFEQLNLPRVIQVVRGNAANDVREGTASNGSPEISARRCGNRRTQLPMLIDQFAQIVLPAVA